MYRCTKNPRPLLSFAGSSIGLAVRKIPRPRDSPIGFTIHTFLASPSSLLSLLGSRLTFRSVIDCKTSSLSSRRLNVSGMKLKSFSPNCRLNSSCLLEIFSLQQSTCVPGIRFTLASSSRWRRSSQAALARRWRRASLESAVLRMTAALGWNRKEAGFVSTYQVRFPNCLSGLLGNLTRQHLSTQAQVQGTWLLDKGCPKSGQSVPRMTAVCSGRG